MLLAITIFLIFVTTTYALNESTHHIEFASQDFGGIIHNKPIEVIYPSSVTDIVFVVKSSYEKGLASGKPRKVAARGNGYSTQGQAQTNEGVVINMPSLPGPTMFFYPNATPPYVDVAAGELWINVLKESVQYGLTPESWTDYLYLTVGGTLSTAGIGGQTFKNGPQMDTVLELEIVTGKGELKTVSGVLETDLLHAVLGGLGQFGIITRARIALAPAPTRVKWIKALYSDFATMSKDQETLVAINYPFTFDYVKGSVIIDGKTQYQIELAKYYSPNDANTIDQKITEFLSRLSYNKPSLNILDVTYIQFLDRGHTTELELRKQGLWEIPHPWLSLLVPESSIDKFVQEVFGNIITESVNGPIFIYPFNKLMWKQETLMAIPNDNVVYMVSISSAAVPSKSGELERLLAMNERVMHFCRHANLGVKQYLPHYTTRKEWKTHYGWRGWKKIVKLKRMYDPLAILAPGQLIFPNGTA